MVSSTCRQIAIVAFVIASLGCGFAQNTGQLIAWRVLQGIGMGALQVLVQVVIAAMSPAVREVVSAAYGDGTAHIFLISAAVAAFGLMAALHLTPTKLRDSIDLAPRALVESGRH
ncbi:MFS transporter [Acrocarpospora sp. B8E8]|uniref:MFS transporter n=1 Tax=Acrocarpospora sp. B8E8 TaxID=3153572 RepID=UPI00325EAD8A